MPAESPSLPLPVPDSVESMVMSGYRFITIPYVYSFVVLSFHRNWGGVHLIRTGEWPIGKVFGAACVTCLVGWWSPSGMFYSLWSLFYLWLGGCDMTPQVLEQIVGETEAKRILAVAPKPKIPAEIWWVRLLIVLPAFCIACLCIVIITS
ncbi:MAG: hypothetical protein H8M99_03550 [Gloeobacteraceae cyanobacterium ES-bin-144]|nr:hypothetical protein [Verrucomicrobiales bacterium]